MGGALSLGDTLSLVGDDTGALTLVNLGLGDPQRLGIDPGLLTHPTQRAGPVRWITPQFDRHPDRPLPNLLGALPRCCHDSPAGRYRRP